MPVVGEDLDLDQRPMLEGVMVMRWGVASADILLMVDVR